MHTDGRVPSSGLLGVRLTLVRAIAVRVTVDFGFAGGPVRLNRPVPLDERSAVPSIVTREASVPASFVACSGIAITGLSAVMTRFGGAVTPGGSPLTVTTIGPLKPP